MLKNLRIQNLILVENTAIIFEKGFNILSGETGAGKSAVMEALALVLGERADTNVIRKGSEKGIVEALFDIQTLPSVVHLLSEAGIDHDPQEELIIRREILGAGKSRAFINHQSAQLALLQSIGKHLVKFVGQHANHQLFNLEVHRQIIDQYGGLVDLAKMFSQKWSEENQVKTQLQDLKDNEAKRLREIDRCRSELEEINEIGLKEGEEETLFAEYSRLNQSEERALYAREIVQALHGEKQSMFSLLNKLKHAFDRLVRLDSSLEEMAKVFQDSILGLQEIGYSMQNYLGRMESDPERMQEVNERLSIINRFKKKYGSSFADVEAYRLQLEERLVFLENANQKIEDMQEQLEHLEKESQACAEELSRERKKVVKSFEKEILVHLRSLNMPKVEFQVQISSQKRSSSGDDRIEFFMAPNIGEHLIPIKECASGGELSRLVLALHVLLAGKEKIPTLLFDEVDANIGGETAATVGEKLRGIGENHQVICITHFPQVAICAHHHLLIYKEETGGRTVTSIRYLDSQQRQKELSRMMGGNGAALLQL